MRVQVLLFASMIAVAGEKARIAQGVGRDKVVATVNGVDIYHSDLRIPATPKKVDRRKLVRDCIERAIDQELLYQVAVKKGLEGDPKYLRWADLEKRMQAHRETKMIASFYEQQIEAIKKARDARLTEQEIPVVCKQYLSVEWDRLEAHVKQAIRQQLGQFKYRKARNDWLKSVVKDVAVSVAGNRLAPSVLEDAVDRYVGVGVPTRPQSPGLTDPLGAAVANAAGITLPSNPMAASPTTVKEAREQLRALRITVGKTTFRLGDLHFALPVLDDRMPFRLDSLFHVLQPYMVREIAMADGVEDMPGFKKQLEQARAQEKSPKQLLAARLLSKQGFHDPDRYKIKPAEIDQYYTEHQQEFGRVPRSNIQVRKVIEDRLKQRKLEVAKQEFLAELRKTATITIP